MYQCPHLTSLSAKTGTEQGLGWVLFSVFCCACVLFGRQRVHCILAHVGVWVHVHSELLVVSLCVCV